MSVARRAAEAEHRVLFSRFEGGAADQLRVFVRLEIGQADNHGLRIKGCRNGANAFRELLDEKIGGALIPAGEFCNRLGGHPRT